jgi:hypothetical protein
MILETAVDRLYFLEPPLFIRFLLSCTLARLMKNAMAFIAGFEGPLALLLLFVGGGHTSSSCLAMEPSKPALNAIQLRFPG